MVVSCAASRRTSCCRWPSEACGQLLVGDRVLAVALRVAVVDGRAGWRRRCPGRSRSSASPGRCWRWPVPQAASADPARTTLATPATSRQRGSRRVHAGRASAAHRSSRSTAITHHHPSSCQFPASASSHRVAGRGRNGLRPPRTRSGPWPARRARTACRAAAGRRSAPRPAGRPGSPPGHAKARRARALHDLQGELLPQRPDPLPAQQRAQPARPLGAAVLQRLADRAQAEQGRRLDVVEADHRQLAGHPIAAPVRRGEHAHRLGVGRREDGRRPVRQREQLRRPAPRRSPGRAGRAAPARGRSRRRPPPAPGGTRSAGAATRRSRGRCAGRRRAPRMVSPTKPIRRCPSDSRCPVASRPPATSSVTVCGTPGASTSTVTSGTPARRNDASCCRGQPQRHHDHAVRAVPAGQRGQVVIALLGGVDVAHHGVVALLVQHGQRARPAASPPTAGSGAAPRSPPCAACRGTARRPGGWAGTRAASMTFSTRRPGRLPHVRRAVDDPGDRADAHARRGSYIRDRGPTRCRHPTPGPVQHAGTGSTTN